MSIKPTQLGLLPHTPTPRHSAGGLIHIDWPVASLTPP